MQKLYESSYLIKISDENKGSIVESYPEGAILHENEELFSIDCYPGSSSKEKPILFAFNIDQTFYFSLSFPIDGTVYVVSIESKLPFRYLFTEFLKEAINEFEKNEFNDPSLRFAYITSLLATWENELKTDIELNFPAGITSISITEDHYIFGQYGFWAYFYPDDILQAYECLIHDEPILIIAKDPHTANKAMFSLLSLFSPIQFFGPMALWMPENDPRLQNISETNLKVVCTPVEKIENTKYFNCILKISPRKVGDYPDYRNPFVNKNKYFQYLLKAALDDMLLEDPFSDIIPLPVPENLIKSIASENTGVKYDEKAARAFNTSLSWKIWRSKNIYRSTWLEAMKSMSPNDIINKHNKPEELKIIKESLHQIPSEYKNDKHLMALVRNYKKIIESLLK